MVMARTSFLAPVAALLLLTPTLPAAERPILVGDSLEAVLKLTPEELAEKFGDPSEAGTDRAARLWAVAKRVETESRLARRSVRRIMVLNHLRSSLDVWQDLQLEITYIDAGGGTMWGHLMSRNDATLEEFLAGIADHLLVVELDPDVQATKEVDDLLLAAEKWLKKVEESRELSEGLQEEVVSIRERLKGAHEQLKWAFAAIGDKETEEKVLSYCREAMKGKKIAEG